MITIMELNSIIGIIIPICSKQAITKYGSFTIKMESKNKFLLKHPEKI